MSAPRPALPELLAPAGSPEAFRAAVAAGADAIYLSGKRFGARKFAANFSDTEIAEAVSYAHSHGIRVYVTVNTLIHDRELGGALEYLAWLWSVGVDAVLVQDTGLAALARELVPGLTLHASTQMTIHNAAGVRWAHEHGFSRVVLARELALPGVARIAEETHDTGVGLEVFTHGALCYGYSGQCLLSSVIGGRSGNRGMCAQPCRKPYELVTGETDAYGRPVRISRVAQKDPFLLSPKDLCTYRRLPELVRSPVASLKIEGRMKSPEYVAIVVSTYRRALDAIAAGSWKPSDEVYRDLLLAFNRGFTEGYLFGDRYGKLMARDAPDNRGVLIGQTGQYDRKTGTVFIRPVVPGVPVTGDGILITHQENPGKELGFALNTTPVKTKGGYTLSVPAPVRQGSAVFLTSSRELEAKARRILAKPPADLLRPLTVDLDVTVHPDGSFRITGTIIRPDGTTVTVPYTPGVVMEPARTHPVTGTQLEEQFRKAGGTPFAVRHCTVQYAGGRSAPMGVLNEVRRAFFQEAEQKLLKESIPEESAVIQARQKIQERFPPVSRNAYPSTKPGAGQPALSVYVDTVDGAGAAAGASVTNIFFEPYLPGDRHRCGQGDAGQPFSQQVAEVLALCRDAGITLVLKLPRICHDSDLDALLPEIRALHGHGLAACMSENPGISAALLSLVPSITLYGAGGLNIFNHASARTGMPYALLTLSPELSGEDIALLTSQAASQALDGNPAFSLIVQGGSEAMVTEDCIPRILAACTIPGSGKHACPDFLGIRDDTGRVFPVRADGQCRTHIANASEICLIDLLRAVRDAGVTDIALDARGRPPAYIREMTALYREALEIISTRTGSERDRELGRLKNRVKEIATGGITAGHFLRGLKE
jgi:putative protease